MVGAGVAEPKEFWCYEVGPTPGDLDSAYVLVAGQSSRSDWRNVLAYERRLNHEYRDELCVLFADQHAEMVRDYDALLKLLAETDWRLNHAEWEAKMRERTCTLIMP